MTHLLITLLACAGVALCGALWTGARRLDHILRAEQARHDDSKELPR